MRGFAALYVAAATALVIVLEPAVALDLVRIAAIAGILVQTLAIVLIGERYRRAWRVGDRGRVSPRGVWGMGFSYLLPQYALAFTSLALFGGSDLIIDTRLTGTPAPVIALALAQLGAWVFWLRPLLRAGRGA